jgi:spore coat protein CotH
LVVVIALLAAGPVAQSAAADGKKADAADKEVFGLTKVYQFDLTFTAKEWEGLQPAGGGFRGFPGGPGFPGAPNPEKPAEKSDEPKRETHRSVFGVEFPYAHGEFSCDGKTYKDVAFRYKGNASYMASARGLKRNFKVELDRYAADQRFQGLKTINLNAGAMDPTKCREALSFAVFRAAGVPAPRTAWAEATLTVPGKYDKEYLGLYTFIEQVDRTFLKEHFKNAKGMLLKPERLRGLEYLGEDWAPYKDRYQPKHEPTKEEANRLIAFTKLVNRVDDEQFRKEIGSYLDIDEFLRFVAVNALLVNFDSFLSIGHNYYLYLNPDNNKFVFIPWDLDLSCGGFPMMGGSPDQQLDLSLTHPYMGENKLIDRLLAIKEVSEKYQAILKELSEKCFTKERLLKDLDAIDATTKELRTKDKKAAEARKEGGFGFGGFPGMPDATDLRRFVDKRTQSVAAQVSGQSKGYVPVMTFGFGPPPQPGQILQPPVQNQLRLTAEQKKQLEELQKEADAQLDQILTEDQKKQLKAMRQGPGGPPGPPRPPE